MCEKNEQYKREPNIALLNLCEIMVALQAVFYTGKASDRGYLLTPRKRGKRVTAIQYIKIVD
jgi:hypothetical protein